MYCPTCGSEERQPSQFCRACGTDMRAVRITLERPDAITASAVSAREQIGRAVADRIRATKSASQLQKVAEEVLPEIEKFLESPAERRLRRLRTGMIMAFIGVGGSLGAILASMRDEDLFIIIIPALIMLFIGLGVMLNGLMFTIPRKQFENQSDDFLSQAPALKPPAKALEQAKLDSLSVTEHTTHQLKVNQ